MAGIFYNHAKCFIEGHTQSISRTGVGHMEITREETICEQWMGYMFSSLKKIIIIQNKTQHQKNKQQKQQQQFLFLINKTQTKNELT